MVSEKKRILRRRMERFIACPACGKRFNPDREEHECEGMKKVDKENEYEEV